MLRVGAVLPPNCSAAPGCLPTSAMQLGGTVHHFCIQRLLNGIQRSPLCIVAPGCLPVSAVQRGRHNAHWSSHQLQVFFTSSYIDACIFVGGPCGSIWSCPRCPHITSYVREDAHERQLDGCDCGVKQAAVQ